MPAPPKSEPTQINLNVNLPVSLGKLQVALQRLSDLVTIGLTGGAKVEDSDYREPREFASLQMAADKRMSLSKAQEEFQAWRGGNGVASKHLTFRWR